MHWDGNMWNDIVAAIPRQCLHGYVEMTTGLILLETESKKSEISMILLYGDIYHVKLTL